MNDVPTPTRETKPFLQDTNRLSLAFGLSTGVAIFSTIWAFTLLAKVGGETSTTKKTTTAAAVTNTAPTPTPTAAANPEPTAPVQLAEVTQDDHVRGKFDAPITVVEFSDFQCPYCARFHPTMQRVMADYGDKVRWVYKHFPLDFHPNARPAALAAECVAEQKPEKFWEFTDKAFENQQLLSADFYATTAKSLGINEKKFKTCVDEQKYASRVDSDTSEGTAAGVNGTPTSFINGVPISGAQPYETVKAKIDALLAAN